ncbi:MAG: hypothetical protein UY16_C0029G0015 [Candidatus Gottesmanbacteria bacterium GW2011_GWA2_47_9]|uniref:AB hydrolase-1 domain-containing protein n=1 Tax=Candidatus Gottesmanbacteria bacterium GW2011_GWA2_47_9 TaxID=1618445 RepID=A0A0G1TZW6_9BACT|nr:MAG: hypothetical protein UY16_C0029G0015 [Candidatus Gottesmanbacteria bacterium GW2011_GWA2_47_9]
MGSENVMLPSRDFGVDKDGVPLSQVFLDIKAPTDQHVRLQALVWQRSADPIISHDIDHHEVKELEGFPPEVEPPQIKGQLVFLSGLSSTAADWPVAYQSFGKHWSTIVGLDHPEAPSSTITPHDRPLNDESFHNSGFVELRAIEQLIQQGVLKPGEITLAGYSTGGAVAIEAVAQDIREAQEGKHERYIKNLVLFSPAGIIDMGDFATINAGVQAAFTPYFKEYMQDVYREGKWFFRKKLIDTLRSIKDGRDQNGTDTTTHISLTKTQRERGKTMWEDEYWKQAQNEQLVARNVTGEARGTITDTNVLVYLFDNDQAVPPERFLTPADRRAVDLLILTKKEKRTIATALRRNVQELEQKEQVYTSQDEYNAQLYQAERKALEGKKAEKAVDRIFKRVKQAFPNNTTTYIAMGNDSHHITPRGSHTPLLAAMLAQTLSKLEETQGQTR